MGIFDKLKEAIGGESVDCKALIKDGAVVLDVRSPQEYAGGHGPKSINIPLQNLKGSVDQFKGKVVVTVCKSGMRSAQARSILKSNGIEAHNGGAWQNVV